MYTCDEAREANIRQFVTPAVSYQIVKQSDRLRVDTHTFGYRIDWKSMDKKKHRSVRSNRSRILSKPTVLRYADDHKFPAAVLRFDR